MPKQKSNKKNQEAQQKEFLGFPMNWDLKNWHKDLWNPESDELFPPKRFGIGYGCNFHAVLTAIGIIKSKNANRKE